MPFFDLLFYLIDEQMAVHASVIAIGASLSCVFRKVYHAYDAKANSVSDVKVYTLSQLKDALEAAPDKTIPYAAVKGVVGADTEPLQSINNVAGVINMKSTSEVRERWTHFSRSWNSEDIVIASALHHIPFHLRDGKTKSADVVHVENAPTSDWFDDTLETVSEEFTPKTELTILENMLSLTNGERLRGYSKTERMLKVGASVLAIGEVKLDEDGIKIRAPAKAIYDYIVSCRSQNEIAVQLQGYTKAWKFISAMTCGATVFASYHFVRKLRGRYVTLKKQQLQQLDVEMIRRRRAEQRNPPRECCQFQQNACVVCIENPRECVLLDCGHICICVDCFEKLPRPLRCPICREDVERCLPLYNV